MERYYNAIPSAVENQVDVSVDGLVLSQLRLHSVQPVNESLESVFELAREQQGLLQLQTTSLNGALHQLLPAALHAEQQVLDQDHVLFLAEVLQMCSCLVQFNDVFPVGVHLCHKHLHRAERRGISVRLPRSCSVLLSGPSGVMATNWWPLFISSWYNSSFTSKAEHNSCKKKNKETLGQAFIKHTKDVFPPQVQVFQFALQTRSFLSGTGLHQILPGLVDGLDRCLVSQHVVLENLWR
ncbi:hypothetical protein EYF80_022546 [Liparis tanakae]|uniref:Uncharacterized protein n=1 Tax=Liparis tanakae TaxID=230148 RepID=A0A4Z2HMY5_9TELE|nr:hypothetical protein EYF80_022546 [Liparis tanakae]